MRFVAAGAVQDMAEWCSLSLRALIVCRASFGNRQSATLQHELRVLLNDFGKGASYTSDSSCALYISLLPEVLPRMLTQCAKRLIER